MRQLNLLPTLCLATWPLTLVACGGGGGGGGSTPPGAGEVDDLEILDLGLPAQAQLIGEFDPLAEEYALRLPFLGDELLLRPIYANPSAVSTGTSGLEDAGFGELEASVVEGDNTFEFVASLPASGEQRTVRMLVQRDFAADLRQANSVKSTDARPGDGLGSAVAMDGRLLVVGAPTEDVQFGAATLADAGAVYLFERSGDAWAQIARLQAPVPGADDNFGASVAIDDDLLVVGAPGEDGSGTQVDPQVDENATNCGAAYVFRRIDGLFTPAHYLKPDAATVRRTSSFGAAVEVAGLVVAVGAPEEGTRLASGGALVAAQRAGAVYTFGFEGGQLRFGERLQAPDAAVAAEYGSALAAFGTRLAIGAPGANGLRGKAYLLRAGPTTASFDLEAELVAPNAEPLDGFGESIDLSKDRLVIGAPFEDSGAEGVGGDQLDNTKPNAGAAYMFELKGQLVLFEAYIKGTAVAGGEQFGRAVALVKDTLCVGAPRDIGAALGEEVDGAIPVAPIGSAFVYTRRAGGLELGKVLRSQAAHAEADFGASVAIGADDIAIGSPRDRTFGQGIDGSSVVMGGQGRGAVLTFR